MKKHKKSKQSSQLHMCTHDTHLEDPKKEKSTKAAGDLQKNQKKDDIEVQKNKTSSNSHFCFYLCIKQLDLSDRRVSVCSRGGGGVM